MIDTALICASLANFLDTQAEVFDRSEISGGWARHLRRDAELLRIRARRLHDEAEADEHAEDSE